MQTAIVKYQIATYSGTVRVSCHEDDESETVIAKAKKIALQKFGGSFPYGCEIWKIIERY